jgi:imidazolonepropionase-like amidohydrolase
VLSVKPMMIKDVTVIDATGALPAEHRDVSIVGGRIAAISPTGDDEPRAGAEIVDGAGQFLIPGMWETQAHLARYANGILEEHDLEWPDEGDFEILDANTRSYLRNGFTSVVDLGGPEELHAAQRIRLETGGLIGPRLFFVGRQFVPTGGLPRFGDRPMTSLLVECDHPDEVVEALDRMAALGIDAVKINHTPELLPFGKGWPIMQADSIAAMVEHAHALGLPVLAHIDRADSAASILELGIDGIEHFPEVHDRDVEADVELLTSACLEHDAYWSMTLSWHEAFARLGDPAMLSGTEGQVLPKVLERLVGDPKSMWNSLTDDVHQYFRGRFEAAMAHIKTVHDAGVKMTLSSDSGNAATFHGLACRREMELMAQAGVAPADILRSATQVAAAKFRREADLGTVEPGKLADLVLLEADPLKDISNVAKIRLVIRGGVSRTPSEIPL